MTEDMYKGIAEKYDKFYVSYGFDPYHEQQSNQLIAVAQK